MNDNKTRVTKENLHLLLATFIENEKLSQKDVAKVIGCAVSVISRVLKKETLPSENLLKRCHTMFEIGYKKYKKLSNAEKEKISEIIGTVGSGGLGVGASISAISSLGISGLSAAGMTSGLATLGAIAGGGMATGIVVVTVIPIIAGLAGFGLIKCIKYICSNRKLNAKEINPFWEDTIIGEKD